MSIVHMVILAVIAIIVIPPDKLPEVARQVARFFNDIRRSTSGVWDDIKKDAMLKPEDLMKPPTPPAQSFNPPHINTEVKPESAELPPAVHEGHGPESVPHETVVAIETTKDETKKHD